MRVTERSIILLIGDVDSCTGKVTTTGKAMFSVLFYPNYISVPVIL